MNGKISAQVINNEIVIKGNAEGLKHLAEVCLRIAGKEGPAAHWHFSVDMGNLQRPSTSATIFFEE